MKSYKLTLHPDMKTIIESVMNWTKFGLKRREKYGLNFISVILAGDVYENISININSLRLTNE